MIKVSVIPGPDNGAFLYLHGYSETYPSASQTRSVALAALASGSVTIATEKAALIADVEQSVINLQAANAAIGEL